MNQLLKLIYPQEYQNPLEKRRVNLIVVFSLGMVAMMLLAMLANLLMNPNFITQIVILSVIVFFASPLIVLRFSKNIWNTSVYFIIFLFLNNLSFLILGGGLNFQVAIWLLIYSQITFFLLGRKWGTVSAIYSLVTGFTFFILHIKGIEIHDYIQLENSNEVNDSFLSYTLMMGVSFILTFHFEKSQTNMTEHFILEKEKLNEITKALQAGSWDYNFENQTGTWSDDVYEIFELSIGDQPSLSDGMKLYHPYDIPVVQKAFLRLTEKGIPYDIEVRAITKSNTEKWIRIVGLGCIKKNGSPVKAYGIMQDINKQKIEEFKKHEQLTQEFLAFKTMFDNSPVPMGVYVIDKGLIDCNQEAITLFQAQNKQELIGVKPSKLSPEFQPNGEKSTEYAKEKSAEYFQNKYARFDWQFEKLNGDLFITDHILSEIIHPEGEAILVTWHDLTARIQAEEAIKSSEVALKSLEFKDEFLAKMSHEIRTPLNGIIGLFDLLDADNLTKDQKDYIKIMKSSGDDLIHIVNDILDIAKLEAGKLHLNENENDLNTLIQKSIILYSSKAKEKGIDLKVKMDEFGFKHIFDSSRLTQILNNLISNAIKFTHEGAVEVIIKHSNDEQNSKAVYFEIKDTGSGIPANKMTSLFEKFEQLDTNSNKREDGTLSGTGLGLPICKELVELMGGNLEVKSTENEGSSFYFEVPMQQGSPISIENSKKNTKALDNQYSHKVLLVDDKLVNLTVGKLILEKTGCVVELAGDGKEAYEKAVKGSYDLILMDIQMPVMDGVESTQAIKKDMENPPIIIGLSANNMEGDKEKYIALGLDDYIAKPIKKDKIEAILSSWKAS